MIVTEIIEALRSDPGLAEELHGALLARDWEGKRMARVNVSFWRADPYAGQENGKYVAGWECVSVGGFRLASVACGRYWHERLPYVRDWPRAPESAAIRICTEALEAAGWVVHR